MTKVISRVVDGNWVAKAGTEVDFRVLYTITSGPSDKCGEFDVIAECLNRHRERLSR